VPFPKKLYVRESSTAGVYVAAESLNFLPRADSGMREVTAVYEYREHGLTEATWSYIRQSPDP
jgi:hypothetical protein